MKRSAGSIIHTVNLGDLGEQDFDISYSYLPGDPGRVSGPPENCWPPESSEIELLAIQHGARTIGWPLDELLGEFLHEDDAFHEAVDVQEAAEKHGRERDE